MEGLAVELLSLVLEYVPLRGDKLRFALACRHCFSAYKLRYTSGEIPSVGAVYAGNFKRDQINNWFDRYCKNKRLGSQKFWMKEGDKPWQGIWATQYFGRLSFGGGCNVHQWWYGEYRVINCRGEDQDVVVSVLLTPITIVCNEYGRTSRSVYLNSLPFV